MGVTSSLRKLDGCEIKEINDFLYQNMPTRDKLTSNLGVKAFDTKYVRYVGSCIDHSLCRKIGAISELFIDVIVSRFVNIESNILQEIASMILIKHDGKYAVPATYKDSGYRITSCLKCVISYVRGENILDEEVIEALNTIDKHGLYPFNSSFIVQQWSDEEIYDYIFEKKLSEDVVYVIKQIGKLFLDKFVENGLLKSDSTVIIKPKFGAWSTIYGAEGDIYIDGIIYDIKSRSKEGYRRVEIAQIYAYYLCYLLDKYYDVTIPETIKPPSNLNGKEVTGIGIYMSRFGEIVTCDMNKAGCCLSKMDIKPIADMVLKNCQNLKNERLDKITSKYGEKVMHVAYDVTAKRKS